jgi:hypothetical protein
VLLAVVGGLYWYFVERDRLEPTHTPHPDDSRQPILAGSPADSA